MFTLTLTRNLKINNNLKPCDRYVCLCLEYLDLTNKNHIKIHKKCFTLKDKTYKIFLQIYDN